MDTGQKKTGIPHPDLTPQLNKAYSFVLVSEDDGGYRDFLWRSFLFVSLFLHMSLFRHPFQVNGGLNPGQSLRPADQERTVLRPCVQERTRPVMYAIQHWILQAGISGVQCTLRFRWQGALQVQENDPHGGESSA